MLFRLIAIILILASSASAQLISKQEWQTATLSSDTLSIANCWELLLPPVLGRPLSEPAATSTYGEMSQSLSSPHPVRVAISPQIGTTDDLATISGCVPDGAMVQVITANSGDTITLKHGVGNIELPNDADILLTDIHVPLRLVRKGAVFILDSGGGGGGSGSVASVMGNPGPTIVQFTMVDGMGIDMSGCSPSAANECFVMPMDATCLTMATEGQLCYSAANKHIYVWDGTDAIDLSAAAVLDLEGAAQNGRAITSADSQGNAVFIGDSSGDGFRIYTGAQGPVIECTVSGGTCDYVVNVASGDNFIINLDGTPALTIPSTGVSGMILGTAMQEVRTLIIPVDAISPDGTNCIKGDDVTINAEIHPFTITCQDLGTPTMKRGWMSNNAWDLATIQVKMGMTISSSGVDNIVAWDWVAYCAGPGDELGHNTYPSPTSSANNRASFNGSSFSINDYVTAQTGNITLTGGCAQGDWISLKGYQNVDDTLANSTDNLHHLSIQVLMTMISWSD